MQPTVRRTTQPAPCITLAAAKQHLGIETTDSDAYINSLIAVAGEYIAARIGRALSVASYEMTMDRFPRRTGYRDDSSPAITGQYTAVALDDLPLSAVPIELPYPPIYSADAQLSISYTTYSGAVVPLVEGVDYEIHPHAVPPQARPPYSQGWPLGCRHYPGSVRVTWRGGYGDIPPQITHSALMLVSHWFEHRDAVSSSPGTAVPEAVEALLSSVSTGYYAQKN